MTHASLFSGIGGFDLAASWAGWENMFWCEKDMFCQRVLKYHFKESIGYEDIKKTDFREWNGRIDVLSGGFPCQPFSVAGQRKGAADDRYLWPEMLRAIREIRPCWVVGENVGGIISMVQPGSEIEVAGQASLFEENHPEAICEQEFAIETICRDFEREGYSVRPILIPACGVGAPHRRDRVWIVAYCPDAGIESLQRKWKDGVCEFKTTSDPNSYDDGRNRYEKTGCETGESKIEQKERERIWTESERISNKRIATDPASKQSQRRKPEQRKLGEQKQKQSGGGNSENSCERYKPDSWQDFPAQPPICRRDDGLSAELDSISFSKWRTEAVKAYGNAIVPQAAYQIFKAIKKLNNGFSKK